MHASACSTVLAHPSKLHTLREDKEFLELIKLMIYR